MTTTTELQTISLEPLAAQIDQAISSGSTFGLVFFPGETTPVWFDSKTSSDTMVMEIAPWLAPFSKRLVIGRQETGSNIPIMEIPEQSTSRAAYIEGVNRVIASCTLRDGKTVYSRIICGRFEKATPRSVAQSLFAAHPQSLRFIYFTPQTGGWLGATPEVLLDFDKATGKFSTMALAGTRRRGTHNPWDTKNLRENRFVIDYITDSLAALGITVRHSPLETLAYGEIEHLCSHISGYSTPERIPEIIDALNPTPALCGYPKNAAIADISHYENHPRGCYGGVIGFSSPNSYRAFVNLRCMQFDQRRYCIYGGGGIVPQSLPDEEFAETEAKTAFIESLLSSNRTKSRSQHP